ncbi:hypothetical protein [Clostridium botulinum]|uniref:hypothetical protein n=1 Tax=Clostridium botulinum TaxID=1491 RepID=UPI00035BAA0D|nr:hypothetical protein [Clostridium botulinum]AUN06638.1 hypothetical protein RSJ14_07930 [Clostridium botulinum]EPS56459.1 hypothetical protein CLQ_02036 [Clostridium botulinum Af84]MBN3352727.1 hypothetical protein [Clostridium botulinum]MBN3358950.1 hypothetical protein [Clostridium botulinum]MBN3365633.1 hypothetical protein [Clostridium botulinum]
MKFSNKISDYIWTGFNINFIVLVIKIRFAITKIYSWKVSIFTDLICFILIGISFRLLVKQLIKITYEVGRE